MPEDWVTLPDSLKKQKVAIGIDEVTNFFNNHVWYNKMCDMMAALMSQRRKFEVAILMTGPIFERLPPVIREMVHEIIHCQDMHTINHSVPRGEKCIYYKQDIRGLLSHPKRHFSRKKIFYTKPWWKHYDTFSQVDAIHQFMKVRFKGREIAIGADGKVISQTVVDSDPATLARFIQEQKARQNAGDERYVQVKKVLSHIKKKGLNRIAKDLICGMLNIKDGDIVGPNGYGRIIKELGVIYDRHRKEYVLEGVGEEGR